MQRFGIGQPVRRTEDHRFITGRGEYVDDIALPGQCFGALVSSPHAHARIAGIEMAAACSAPGVIAILTGHDVMSDGLGGLPPLFMPQDAGGPAGYRTCRPILLHDIVRSVGDRVAFVIAENAAQARDAADLVQVDYDPLPPVVHVEDALAAGAPAVWDACPGNVSFAIEHGDAAATTAAFAAAPHQVSLRLRNNRISANAMEVRGAIGHYEPASGFYTLRTSSQNPHGARTMLARDVFHVPETQVRVIAPDVGGGFGMKADCYPEDALVLWASRRCGRPVKWISSRSEGLAGDNHGRDQVVEAALAFDDRGTILAIRADALHAVGAYHFSAGVAPLLYSLRYIPSVYDVKTVHLRSRAIFTHTTPLGVYRGAGRPEAIYVIERLLDEAAVVLGIGADEIRRRNFIAASAMPYTTQTRAVYDTGEFGALMEDCLSRADWAGYGARKAESDRRGRCRGRAVAYYIEHAGIYNERMELRFDPGGSLTILAGTHSHGQGHATAFAQLVSTWLGVPFESIRYVQGDTDQVAIGRGTYAARSSLVGGSALKVASDKIITKARVMAAYRLKVAEDDLAFEDGAFSVKGGNAFISITDVAKACFQPVGLPAHFDLGLEAAGTWSGDIPNYPNGCHVCELEIDPDTGTVTIDRYTVVDDCGVPINPMICEGQVHGGIAQGLGQALLEEIVYDRESGQLLTGTFNDYCMPRADNFGPLTTAFRCVPSTTNPLGVKGVGESGAIAAPPAIINAVLDALRPLGVTDIDMPATPSRIWTALRNAARDEPVRSTI